MRRGAGAGWASREAAGSAALAAVAATPLKTYRREQQPRSSPRKRGPSNRERFESGTASAPLVILGMLGPRFRGDDSLRSYANPAFSRSGVNGARRSRMPVASKMALASAPAVGRLADSPAPVGG